MTQAFRKQAGEIVARSAKYIGSTSLKYDYIVRYNGRAYFANCISRLADKVAKAMRSEAAANRERIKRRIKEM